MKLIRHIIFADLKNNSKLMINSLNGLMDEVDNSIFNAVRDWQKLDNIIPESESEISLFNKLNSRGYLVNSYVDEVERKEKLLNLLRKKYDQMKLNNKHLIFVMTYDCNFRCPYCIQEGLCSDDSFSNQKNMAASSKTVIMNKELIDAAFNLSKDPQFVYLFGGEPLLPITRQAFEYIIFKAPDKIYNITSNGYYLEEFLDLLSKIKISQIKVTIDGEEETHNKRRISANGKPTYNKIMTGITKCLENDIPICIRMNIDSNNLDEHNKMKEKLIAQFSEYGNLLSFEINPMLKASITDMNAVYSQLYCADITYTKEERWRRNNTFNQFNPIVNVITANTALNPLYSYCMAHDNGFVVDPHGKIFPCVGSLGIDELAIGSYYPDIFFKDKSIRNRNIDTISECRECIYSLLCGGGCAINLREYGDIFKPDCFSIKNQIHNLLPTFYNISKSANSLK